MQSSVCCTVGGNQASTTVHSARIVARTVKEKHSEEILSSRECFLMEIMCLGTCGTGGWSLGGNLDNFQTFTNAPVSGLLVGNNSVGNTDRFSRPGRGIRS